MEGRALVNAGTRRNKHTHTPGIYPKRIWFKGFLGETKGVWQDQWLDFGMPPRQIVASEQDTTATPRETQEQVAQESTTVAAPC
jgi:hypothetical protein